MSDLVSNLTENGHECCIVTTQKSQNSIKFTQICNAYTLIIHLEEPKY